jgi:predicted DsbA family dithiol-disulfide isomerase
MNYDRVIPANTFDAHRLVHLAARHNLQAQAGERLMKAYFTDGLKINDVAVLENLGTDIGLKKDDVKTLLNSHDFSDDVRRDEAEAKKLGIDAVPFFLINREIPLRGAHPPEDFLNALQAFGTGS